jgi:hypothetical protein
MVKLDAERVANFFHLLCRTQSGVSTGGDDGSDCDSGGGGVVVDLEQ